MDLIKVEAVKERSQSETRKQLQHFLGFANFYRCFIRNYNQITAPLNALTSTARAIVWTPEVS